MTKTFEIKCRNNADAVRIGSGQIRVPGVSSHKHLGRKDVRLVSVDPAATQAWLDAAHEVASYTTPE